MLSEENFYRLLSFIIFTNTTLFRIESPQILLLLHSLKIEISMQVEFGLNVFIYAQNRYLKYSSPESC